MSSINAVRFDDLPRAYHLFKWRVLLAFAVFYLFAYLGRFSLYPLGPLVKDGLGLTNVDIAIIWAMLFWGFALGDVVHGRLAEAFGLRLWVMLGAVLTAVFNCVTSFAVSPLTMAIPLGLAGFVNAACWAPAMSMISQWWPRSRRGIALGIVGTAAGGAMLVMWVLAGWVGAQWGWQAAFRYLPFISAVLGVAFYLMVRDRPADLDFPEYVEEDEVSAAPEAIESEKLRGLGPYRVLMTNTRFLLACHVKGLENVVRYGLTTWVAIYYSEAGGLSIESTVLVTVLLPVGYLIAPPLSGFISDYFLNSQRRPLVITSCIASAGNNCGYRLGAAVERASGSSTSAGRRGGHGNVTHVHSIGRHGRAANGRHGVGSAGRPWLPLRWRPGHRVRSGAGYDRQPMAHRVWSNGGDAPDFRVHD